MANNLGLQLIVERGAGRVIIIPPNGAIIGRQPPAELILNEPAVSRQHCSIYPYRNQWVIEDLGSQNGTFVNGRPISKQPLHPGDRLQVGATVLRVPRNVLKPALITLAATAAGVLIVAFVWHWTPAPPAHSAAVPPSAPQAKSASATTADNSADSDLTDTELLHPTLRRKPR